ncbi:saccharopine dehydrogenase [Nitzschia inconspicua]|uniref:Saccharopine dehydrogenase n=1 Tax=Nitzschia inconspicua TaxID=303405 RepID=A0A9K3LD35_9STRA|nr:saccharopine dehydrogenase [Nitzschia inconspicua]
MPSSSTTKSTDITIYGATSFVAKHILKYLVAVADQDDNIIPKSDENSPSLRISLGGRNKAKLEAIKQSFNVNCIQDVVVADGSDLEGLQAMAKRSQVVLNCAGPYYKYSNMVVEACATVGCDYVDITGEVAWVSEMRAKHGAAAQKSGARIVSLCGYDSIPSDMAVFAAVQALKEGTTTDISIQNARIWHQMFGVPNGGTIHTFCDIPMDVISDAFETPMKKLRSMPYFVGDPLALANPNKVKKNPKYQSNKDNMAKGEWLNQLVLVEPDFFYGVSLPFAMSAVNLKVVQASAAALGYGDDFKAQERYLPLGYLGTKLASVFALIPMLLLHCSTLMMVGILRLPVIGKKVADLAPPGSGVPDSIVYMGSNSTYCKVHSTHEGGKEEVAYSYLKFEGDAGNAVTAQCVSEAALTLVFNRDDLPMRSEDGFGTPAEILGDALLRRFRAAKVRPVVVKTSIGAPIL